ncbi:MAG: ribulose-phosphate 3-epimerase [Bacilli bacterium]|nr:ribulose-phosphate 3-epimerase [Bacilli bacterium]
MLISTSFLSSKNLIQDLKKLDQTDTDFIHMDIMDGKFVRNKTMPFKEMRNIYKYTSKRLDVHLMVQNPERYILDYASLNTEYIVIHLELDIDIEKSLKLIKRCGIQCGLAVRPDTEIKELLPYLPLLDIILVMSVEPGAGGQAFLRETENKIKELKVLLREYHSHAKISVDGGITDLTKSYCSECDILVSGSYIINGNDFQTQIDSLR